MRLPRRLAIVVVGSLLVSGCGGAGATPSPSASVTPRPAPSSPTARPTPGSTATAPPALTLVPSDVAGIAALTASVPRGAGDPDGIQRLVVGDDAFAADLYRTVASDATGNLVFSPYSAMAALAMACGGARAGTADEMAAVLRVGDDPAAWHAARNALAQGLAAPPAPTDTGDPFVLESTNALFGQAGYAFKPAFVALLVAHYGAPLMTVDYLADPERARGAINAWVAARTRDRIPELLGPGTVDDMTRFGLVNAVYFKASWAQHFDAARTGLAPFHRVDGTTVTVPTMHGGVPGEYARGDGWQAVRLWYAGNAAMTIVMPDEGRFADFEHSVDGDLLARLARGDLDWELDRLTLSLPRWKTGTTVDLEAVLTALGIRSLFTPPPLPGGADLGGIADDDLFVKVAVQKAAIAVDENGTEATAATAIMGGTTGAGPVNRTLAVDRPFWYEITDTSTGTVLFMGRVVDPSR